jgi:SAM-dependent methyltransferase
MADKQYTSENSDYLKSNPTWHVEQSPWKATQVLAMIEKNKLHPSSIVEIGCGAGEILNQLHERMANTNIQFSGYEISPDAYKLSLSRQKERLNFFQEDLLQADKYFDLMLMMDVFEHVDDYIGFLKKAKSRSEDKIFHIPLDMTLLSVAINKPMLERNTVGHLHYFSKDTALATLTYCGYEITDWFYTKGGLEKPGQRLSIKGKLINFLRKITYKIKPDLSVKLFGGFSLIVLAR